VFCEEGNADALVSKIVPCFFSSCFLMITFEEGGGRDSPTQSLTNKRYFKPPSYIYSKHPTLITHSINTKPYSLYHDAASYHHHRYCHSLVLVVVGSFFRPSPSLYTNTTTTTPAHQQQQQSAATATATTTTTTTHGARRH
jgi:hypothetical protein